MQMHHAAFMRRILLMEFIRDHKPVDVTGFLHPEILD